MRTKNSGLHIRPAAFSGSPGENIVDKPVISLVTPGSNRVYTGFFNIHEAINYKADFGLGSNWRIRDRRDKTPFRQSHIDPPRDPRDSMLVIASMIRDHAHPILKSLQESSHKRVPVSWLMADFALIMIEEARLQSDRHIGNWRAMRGIVRSDGKNRRAAWLSDDRNNILDLNAPHKARTVAGGIYWAPASTARSKVKYFPHTLGLRDYDDPFIAALRGERQLPSDDFTKENVKRDYTKLCRHIVLFLNCSRIPVLPMTLAEPELY